MQKIITWIALDLDLSVTESADVVWTMKGEENNKYRVRSVAHIDENYPRLSTNANIFHSSQPRSIPLATLFSTFRVSMTVIWQE